MGLFSIVDALAKLVRSRRTVSGRRRGSLFASCILLWFLAVDTYAFEFVPSEQEFAAWPDWCRAVYLVSNVGSNGPFQGRVSPSEVERARAEIHGFWHFCAGLTWLSRAQGDFDPGRRAWEYQQVINETMFNYRNFDSSHPLWAHMTTTLGLAYRGLKQPAKAEEYLSRSIGQKPDYIPAYTALSLVFRDQKNLRRAKEVLIQGNEASAGNSAEVHYFLGLVLLDLNEIDAARQHAARAYSLGYPLPGLRRRLDAVSR